MVREIDDHADIIAVEMVSDCTPYGGKSANLVSFIFYCIFTDLIPKSYICGCVFCFYSYLL